MPLSRSAIRAIAIRNAIKRREANTDSLVQTRTPAPRPRQSRTMLQSCVDAAGFETQRLHYA